MEKKDIQKFIAKLKVRSLNLEKENNSGNVSEEDTGEVTSPEAGTYNKTFKISSAEEQFIVIGNILDDGSYDNEGIGLDFEKPLCGEIDYVALLNSQGISEEKVIQYNLLLPGRTISHHESFDIYSIDTGEYIYTGFPFMDERGVLVYPVDLHQIYKATGSVRFKIIVDEDFGAESFFTDFAINYEIEAPESIKIKAPIEKAVYSSDESFDKTGIVIEATYADGVKETVTNPEFFSAEMQGNSAVIFYRGRTAAMDVTVIFDGSRKDKEKYNYKEFALCDKVNGFLDLNRGTFNTELSSFILEDSALPLNIAHIHKSGNVEGNYGEGWRLSLNKQLKLSQDDNNQTTIYTYTDEFGDSYTFDEKYYIVEDAQKLVVSKNKITIDRNGNLTYDNKPVYKYQYCKGYTLIPEINDYKGCELIEQRVDERIELEEYLLKTEPELKGYVRVYAESGTPSVNNVDFNIEGNFTKENCQAFLNGVTATSNEIIIKQTEYAKLSTENKQMLINTARKNLKKVKYEFSKYFKKKAELDVLLLNTPVCYLKDGSGIISGFNADGDLVLIADSYGRYLAVDRGADGRINSIYDSNKTVAKIEYENELLHSITDGRGRKVEYAYNTSNRLTKVTFPDEKICTISYDSNDNISEIVSPKNMRNKFYYYDGDKLSSIITSNMMFGGKTISELQINCISNNWLTLTTEKGESETYRFDSDNKLIEYTVCDELKKETKQVLTYSNNGKKVTIVESSNIDNKSLTKRKEYNDHDLLTVESVDSHWVTDNTEEYSSTYYLYDLDNKLIRKNINKTQVIYYYPNDENPDYINSIISEKYSYDNHGNITLIESFVLGEEQTSGINYEERVYNDSGIMVKCIRWNSLDSSSKFYEEYECEKDGRLKYDKDETGAYSAMYEYADGTNLVNSVTFANGGKTAYGRNPYNNQITSVTSSTADGEANTNDIVYECGLPAKVTSGNTSIEYSYDHKGRKKEIKINGVTQSTFTFDDTYTYGTAINGCNLGTHTHLYKTGSEDLKISFEKRGTKNSKGVICKTETLKANGTQLYKISYNEKELITYKNYKNEDNVAKSINYQYDPYDRLTCVSVSDDLNENYTYDVRGKLTERKITGSVTQTYIYTYKDNAACDLNYISYNGFRFIPLTDVNGRNKGKEIYNGENKVAGEYITYRKVGDHATNMPSTVWFANGSQIKDSIKYKYDSCGNIAEIIKDGKLAARYSYDSLNRLVKEENTELEKVIELEYDRNGNILRKSITEDGETTTRDYVYDGDKLVSYCGLAFTYNNMGNPTGYKDKICELEYGTRLVKFFLINFAYDGLGRRTKKKFGDETTIYTYDNDGRLIAQSNGLEFFYDANGLAGLKEGNTMYFYRKDAQGNIIAILDSSGAVVAKYIYDAWGNHKTLYLNNVDGKKVFQNVFDNATPIAEGYEYNKKIAKLNPFRYRGYYYDTETAYYYLQSRYYDPDVGRFVSQDSVEYADPETINGLNLYAYCGNNPVMNVDPVGCSWSSFWRKVRDVFSTVTVFLSPVATLIRIGTIGYAMAAGRWSDLKSDWDRGCFNPFNQDADVALKSKVFSFYKGESVVRLANSNAGLQIFGTIFLGDTNINADDLNHEYGHSIQERFLGPAYLTRIALPSVITYSVSDLIKRVENEIYYSMPWERTADWFGGVNRGNYKKGSLGWAFAENILGGSIIPWYFIFGF